VWIAREDDLDPDGGTLPWPGDHPRRPPDGPDAAAARRLAAELLSAAGLAELGPITRPSARRARTKKPRPWQLAGAGVFVPKIRSSVARRATNAGWSVWEKMGRWALSLEARCV
jgi:hypothetical protein